MRILRYLSAGESHGPGISAMLEGIPPGLEVDVEFINRQLGRRQGGYGRGGRQEIEQDEVEILGGVRKGRTTGAPLLLFVRNRDSRLDEAPELDVPRPGHADLAGHLKYGAPVRDILERASARETAGRVAAGAVAMLLLSRLDCRVLSRVISIGEVRHDTPFGSSSEDYLGAEDSPVRCADLGVSARMVEAIEAARQEGTSLGGVFEVAAFGVPAGLGSHVQWDLRLDAALAGAMASIPAVKGMEIGPAFENAARPGSEVHDEILSDGTGGFTRPTNRAGGIEGGISNGMPVILRCAMKPIPTQTQPLKSINLRSGEPAPAGKERSDVCAVPAAAVVGEAMMAMVLADFLLLRNGADRLP